jgi:hypothetical protein
METLIIFLIFIVFSVLKSLGGEAKRPPGRAPGRPPGHFPGMPPGHPVRPVRPGRPVPPLQRPEAVPPEYLDMLFKQPNEQQEAKPVIATKRNDHEIAAKLEISRDGPDDTALIDLDSQTLLQSIVFAEVLGPPKSKKPWQYR